MANNTGKFIWRELQSRDHEAARGFYGELFGWRFTTMDMGAGPYPLIQVGDSGIGGLTAPSAKDTAPSWMSYVAVPDVDAAVKALKGKKGTAVGKAVDVPTVGRMHEVKDPEGARFFLMTSERDEATSTGQGYWNWAELWSNDPAASLAFYRDVIGYESETRNMPNGEYHVLSSRGARHAGIMAAPMGLPAQWTSYVEVIDVDATLAKAKRLGGKGLTEAIEIPGVGRFALLADREGATVGIITPTR